MTDLSPAAQAVHDAFWSHPNGEPLVQDCPDTDQLVAALRAAADQLVPVEAEIDPLKAWSIEDWNHMNATKHQREETRRKLLALADELDPTTDDQPMNELTLKQKELLQLYQQAVADFQSAFDAHLQAEKILDKRRSDCRNAGFNPRDYPNLQ